MKKIVLFVLTLALGVSLPLLVYGQESLIYTQDFGASTPTGWTTAVVTGSPWGFSFNSTTYAYRLPTGNSYCMRIPTDGVATNSWAFMRGITMTAGYAYRVEFCQRVLDSTEPERLRVTVGNAQTVAAQTTILWDKSNMTFTTYYNRTTEEFIPATTGTYYFAFQCYSTAGRARVYVDNVRVWEKTNTYPLNPRHVAQWEPALGALVRYPWGLPDQMLRDLADEDLLFVVTASQTAAQGALPSGINTVNIRYIVAPNDSYWSRDWGPISLFEGPANNRKMAMLDFDYNRHVRPEDNKLVPIIADYLAVNFPDYYPEGVNVYYIPLSLTGGNIMTDGNYYQYRDEYNWLQNDGNMSTGQQDNFDEFYSYTVDEYKAQVGLYAGMVPGGSFLIQDPTGTYINHIDTWAKLVSPDRVIIADRQLNGTNAGDPVDVALDARAAEWATWTPSTGGSFTVYRVYAPNGSAYTNSFLFNHEAYIPFTGITTNDNAAKALFQQALDAAWGTGTYTVTGYTARNDEPWESTDAIHCRVHTIYRTDTDPSLPVELSSFTAMISVDNFVNLTWVTQSETNVQGFYILRNDSEDLATAAVISDPIQATNTSQQQTYIYKDSELYEEGTYYYWLQNADMDGATNYYGPVSIQYALGGGNAPEIPLKTELKAIYPNPFNPIAYLPFDLAATAPVRFEIYNSRGQLVRNLDLGTKTPGRYKAEWDGRDNAGQPCGTGLYQVRLIAGKDSFLRKAVLIK